MPLRKGDRTKHHDGQAVQQFIIPFTFNFFIMKKCLKIGLHPILRVFLILTLLAPATSGFSNTPINPVTCPGPQASITSKSSSSITFGWSAITGAVSYSVWYHRREDNFTSSVSNTGATNITFSGLPPGTYDFYFVTNCSSETSDIIIIVDIVMQ